jgi:hypothetical protein
VKRSSGGAGRVSEETASGTGLEGKVSGREEEAGAAGVASGLRDAGRPGSVEGGRETGCMEVPDMGGGAWDARCRRGKAISGLGPRQSFQVRVTRGGLGGRPEKEMSKAARLMNLPGGEAQSC